MSNSHSKHFPVIHSCTAEREDGGVITVDSESSLQLGRSGITSAKDFIFCRNRQLSTEKISLCN
jgi:hypothetical protein